MVYLFSFVWSIFNIVFRGYLISIFWTWFVMSQFTQLPHLNVVAAIGLSLFVGLFPPPKHLTNKDLEVYKDDLNSDNKLILITNNVIFTVSCLIMWGCGAIVHYFFM